MYAYWISSNEENLLFRIQVYVHGLGLVIQTKHIEQLDCDE